MEPPSPPVPSGAAAEEAWVSTLGEALQDAVLDAARGGPVSLLFSGGLDSSLLAHLLAKAGIPLELLVVGLPGSQDLASASEGASILGLPLSTAVLSPSEVRETAGDLGRTAPALTPTSLAVQTALSLALRHSRWERVLCGQGADELFLGYAHYRLLTGAALAKRAQEDLLQLFHVDFPFTGSMARRLGKLLSAPYLSRGVIEALANVPWEARRGPGEPKALLRKVAVALGLPSSLAGRPKKAFQYGSGIQRLLRTDRPLGGPW